MTIIKNSFEAEPSHMAIPIATAIALLLAAMLGLNSEIATANDVGNQNAPKPAVAWGQESHNFRMSISLPKNVVKVGDPIWVRVEIENKGPRLEIFRSGSLDYQAKFLTESDGQDATPVKGLRRTENVWQTATTIDQDDAYSEKVDLSQIYDVKSGTYNLTLLTPILPFNAEGVSPNAEPMTTLTSNSVQLTVIK